MRKLHFIALSREVLVVFVLSFALFRLSAQSTATLTGTVADPSGAMIAGANVLCRNTATDLELRTVTSGSGLFRVPNVPVGTYEVTVSQQGFATLVRRGIELLTEHTIDLNLTLQVGGTSQTVSVTDIIPLVQSTTSDVQTTVNSRQMAELPLNGRNAFQLAVLAPGVTDTEAGTIPGQQENLGLAVNGTRPNESNWALDGGTYTNAQNGGAPTLPNPDTLLEFTALASNFSAENRGGGAVIKLTTRSGTNQIHGTLFEFLRNDWMDARNFFSLNTEAYKQNQYGGTLGGPIRKHKLFYFGSFQGTNKRGSPSPRTITVPTAAQHNGDFSATGHTIVDPTTGAPFPNNVIPQARWDSIGAKLLDFMPLPNRGPGAVSIPPPSNKDDYQYLAKADYVISQKDHLSGRYFGDGNTYQRDNNSLPGIYGNDLFDNQTAMVSETHTFGPTWVIENQVNYLRTFRHETGVSNVGSMQQLGAKVQPSIPGLDAAGKMTVNLTGYTSIITPKGIDFNPATMEYKGSASHAIGSHFIRFGGNVRHLNDYMLNLGNELGSWTFNAQRTTSASIKNSGDAIAGLLLGLPATFSQSVTKAYVFNSTIFGFWVQDDWKIHRRLTINLGLREDPWIAPRLGDGLMEGFVPGMQSQVAPKAPRGIVFPGDPGISDTVLHDYWIQLAPRAGFAWDVTGNGKTVVRGGYGIYRPGSDVFSLWRYWASAAPGTGASLSISTPPSTADPYAGYAGTVPWPYKPITKDQLATFTFAKNADLHAFYPSTRPGYTQSWNLTIERQVRPDTAVSVAYVANHFIRATSALHDNAAIYAPGATAEAANVDARRPYQGIGDIYTLTEYNHGSFNSLQVSVTKRPAKGLIVQSSYTFSKALDINSSSMLGGAAGQTPRDPYNTNLDKGPADFDTPHSFKAMVIYDLPGVGSARGLVRLLLNGWQLNGIVAARTGFPFTCRSGIDNSFSGVAADTCDQVLQNSTPPRGSDPLLYINPAAFTTNKPGTFGQVGRNTLRRPPVFNLDLAALKRARITEHVQAELRWEVFNAFNHANFDLFYNATTYTAQQSIASSTFGLATHAKDPRLMQVSMKLRF